ncbi:MAG: excinuclease ABC subunit UvrC [Magnetospirillum sp.]|nr:excinuclease ABC subunit UvrC [Magnetospirillum sp.]
MRDPLLPTETAEPSGSPGPLAIGVAVIERNLETMSSSPGVYRMLSAKGDALYVGKAKNLRKRVAAYARPDRLPLRLQRMVADTASMEVITTHTEVEALLLESNLIKRLAPRYNILLRDDKSFPYILLTGDHDWPQIVKHRGARSRKGEYFGPFASAGAVNQTLSALQRAFLLRSCPDTIFANRTRPCLLYQIKRCSAPCVERIGREDYLRLVAEARDFLSGHSQRIQRDLAARMEEASAAMEYEQAAVYRDRIRALSHIQAHQDINPQEVAEADVVALHQAGGSTCVQVFFFRSGCNYGNRAYFPVHAQGEEAAQVMAAFLGQFYADKQPPREVLVSLEPAERAIVAQALSEKAGRKIAVFEPKRGDRRRLVDHALDNAREALGRRLAESDAHLRLLDGVGSLFGLDGAPERVEVYDNSHIQGAQAVGGMIVAGPDGLMKAAYRKFNIRSEDLRPGDDYGMMREVLARRFRRARKEDPDRDRGLWPDLVLIDGGQGQLNAALDVFADLGVEDVPLAAIAKGPDRNAGRERFFVPGREPFSLEPGDPVLYFLQRLRDEAHRFAIGSHRQRRSRAIGQSLLDDVPGIGARRKKALLHHFGAARDVANAGLADLEAVSGISKAMAKKIYDHFHPQG